MHLLCTIPGHGEPLKAWFGLFSQPYPPQVKKKKKKKKALRSSLGKRSVSLRVGLERRCEYGIMDIMIGPLHDGVQMSVGRHGGLVVRA